MSGSEHKDKAKKPGSALTDAVAAALATVDEPAAASEGADAAANGAEGAPDKEPAAKGAPPPAVVGAPPPAVVNQPPMANAPAMVNEPPKTNGAGFRAGPGSFADLLRRWDAGQTAPVIAGAASPGKAADAAPAEAPAEAKEPAAEPEPASAPGADDETLADEMPAEVKEAAAKATKRDPVKVLYYGRTDVGLIREHNEDNFTVADLGAKLRDSKEPREAIVSDKGLILAVCDGMGGAAAGEVASQMAVDTIYETLSAADAPKDRDDFARRVVHAIEEAGHRIFSAAKMDRTRRGMGTTSTLAGLVDNVLFVGQVGDSRAYVLRGEQFVQITKDQSLVNQLIEAGQLTEDEAEAFEHSNIILQALGTTEDVTVDLTFLEMRKGDRLLMCSDGLSGLVHAEMMKEVLQETKELPEAAQKLIQMANAGGGHDNITVILADFDGEGLSGAGKAKVAYQQYPLPPDESDNKRGGPLREPSMKAGASKPGADVKRGDDYGSIPIDTVPTSGPPMALLAIGAVLLLAVIVVAGVFAFGGGGDADDGGDTNVAPPPAPSLPPEPTQEPIGEPIVEPEPTEQPVAVQGTINVGTDIEGATLWVNGVSRGALSDGMALQLEPGAYTLEAREGENVIDSETVTLTAEAPVSVELEMPAGAEPPPAAPAPAPQASPRPATHPVTRPTRPTPRPLGGGPSPAPTPRPLGGGGQTQAPPSNPF